MRSTWTGALSLALALWSSVAVAQQPARPPACTSAEHHQFDFWIGEWNVTLPNGKYAGTNRIEPILTGCVLRETWSGAGGMHGTSYNIYDAAARHWHQTWVDDGGSLLQLDGAFQDGKMVVPESRRATPRPRSSVSLGPRTGRKCARYGSPAATEARPGRWCSTARTGRRPDAGVVISPPDARPPPVLTPAAILWGPSFPMPGPVGSVGLRTPSAGRSALPALPR